MEELIETEEVYIKALQRVVDQYMPAMDHTEDVPTNLVGKKELRLFHTSTATSVESIGS